MDCTLTSEMEDKPYSVDSSDEVDVEEEEEEQTEDNHSKYYFISSYYFSYRFF